MKNREGALNNAEMSNKLTLLFSHIQNGQNNRLLLVNVNKTKAAIAVLNVLQQSGYIRGYRYNVQKPGKIEILLKYKNQEPAIRRDLFVVPRNKVYLASRNRDRSALTIISTSKGIISGLNAHKLNVGGVLICRAAGACV
jgi:small subunit ribosomal protein S8